MSGTGELTAEDQGRVGFYALLSRLLYAGPDAALLQLVSESGELPNIEPGGELAVAWAEFRSACAGPDPALLADEFESMFIGVGKAPVTPYASHYLAEAGRERVLVRLRDRLADLGLARAGGVSEPEDHFAGLLDVMRHLAARGPRAADSDAALQDQARFFAEFIEPAYTDFCASACAAGGKSFYSGVSKLLRAFLDVESAALKMV